jgi:hypothetical protein
LNADAQGVIKALQRALEEAEAATQQAATEAAAAENQRAAELAAKAEEAARAENERARLETVAGLSPEHIAKAEAVEWAALGQTAHAPALHGFLDESPNGARAAVAKAKLTELERQVAAAIEAHERQMRQTEELAPTSAPGKRRLGPLQRLWRRARPDGS